MYNVDIPRHLDPTKSEGYPSLPDYSIADMKVQVSPFPTIIASMHLDSNYNEGYPMIVADIDLSVLKVQTSPFPALMISEIGNDDYNEGYPTNTFTGDMANLKVQSRPFPALMISEIGNDDYNEGYPTNFYVGDITNMLIQRKPYPIVMPSLEPEIREGYPSHRRDEPFFGAFSNVSTLIKVKIPKSVKNIADYVFYNTQITSVKISRDCKIGAHSFPDGCEILYYDD
jgi:hypothetical protein